MVKLLLVLAAAVVLALIFNAVNRGRVRSLRDSGLYPAPGLACIAADEHPQRPAALRCAAARVQRPDERRTEPANRCLIEWIPSGRPAYAIGTEQTRNG